MFKFVMSEVGKILLEELENNIENWAMSHDYLTKQNDKAHWEIWIANEEYGLKCQVKYITPEPKKGEKKVFIPSHGHECVPLKAWDRHYLWKFIKPLLKKWEKIKEQEYIQSIKDNI